MILKTTIPDHVSEITLKQFKTFEKEFKIKSKGIELFFSKMGNCSENELQDLWITIKNDTDIFLYDDCPYMLKIVNIFSSNRLLDSQVSIQVLEELFFSLVALINTYKPKEISEFEHAGFIFELPKPDLSNIVIGEFLEAQKNVKDPIQNFNQLLSNIVKVKGKDLTLEQFRSFDTLSLDKVLDVSFFLQQLLVLYTKRLKNYTSQQILKKITNSVENLQKNTPTMTQ